MTDIYETAAQLAALWPALAAALARDTAGGDPVSGSGVTAGVPYNPDVLAAAIVLLEEIPAAHHAACDLLGERWAYRQPGACLLALPRFASRMDATGRFREASVLASQAAGWLRLTKRALGLRKPDIPLGYPCPYAADAPENHQEGRMLFAAGDEGFLRTAAEGMRVEWVATSRIYCQSADCGEGPWGPEQWLWLGRLLTAPAAVAS